MANSPRPDGLTAEQRRQIEALFNEAADRPPDERTPYLDANATDPAVRREVDALLRHLEVESDPDGVSPYATRGRKSDLDRVGARLGHYTLTRLLGRGGMGVVYAARDEKLGREVAIKILPSELATRPELRSRFAREARAVAALNHPNIVTVHSVEETDGEHFLTMELLAGRRLSEVIPRFGLPLNELFRLAVPLVDAVSVAHEEGIIHRDLKPDNVVVTEDGRVKVLDFGLAKLKAGMRREGDGLTGIAATAATVEGKIMGTAAYMSPEQAEGKPVDTRSDVFSLGIVLYEMATGRRPFEGDSSISVISSILKDTPLPVTEVNPRLPHHLGRIVKRCLAKDPARRYQTALDLRNELEVLREEIDSGELEGPVRFGPSAAVRRLVTAVAGLVLIVSVFAVYLLLRGGGPRAGVAASFDPHLVRLTNLPGIEVDPSLSPDGKEFVYAADGTGNRDIYLQRVGSGRPQKNLTERFEADDYHPAFSPDGRHIAFRSEREGGGIFIMDVTGENPRMVTTLVAYHPAWSPDGTKLAVSTERISWPSRFLGPSRIYVVDIASGRIRRLVRGEENTMQPHWSPDGSRIAYWSFKGGRGIWTIPAEGGEAVLVIRDTKNYLWNPVWSPDGRYLYFCSARGGTMGVYRVPIDQTTGEVLGPVESIIPSHLLVSQPSLSADGRKIAHVTSELRNEIVKIPFDPDRGTITRAPSIVRAGLNASLLDVSPDGNWLVYMSFMPREDIYVIRTDGSEGRRLVSDNPVKDSLDRFPRWSPDGSMIAFYSSRCGWQIETIRVDGGELLQRTEDATYRHANPIWSTDREAPKLAAQRFVGVVSSGHPTVIFDAAGSGSFREILELPAWPGSGESFRANSWSPDGRQLAGCILKEGKSEDSIGVACYSFERRSYSKMWKTAGKPRWLPDSRKLLILGKSHGDTQELHVLDTESGTVRSLRIPSHSPEAWCTDLAPSSDGRALYLARWHNRSDIWLQEMR